MRLRLICIDRTLKSGPGPLIAGGRYGVGRSSRCAFVVNDLSVTRHHADVVVRPDTLIVVDRGSRNGTFVDGVRVKESAAKPGQKVRFGSANFQVVGYEHESSEELSDLSTHFVKTKPVLLPAQVKQLTEAQKKILDCLIAGLSEKEVATKLDLSRHTVHTQVKSIYKKLDVRTRAELIALFVDDQSLKDQ